MADSAGRANRPTEPLDPSKCLRLLDALFAPPEPPLVAADPVAGEHVGRFELVRVIGRGGFGNVYLARDPRLDREVAVKTPRTDVLLTSELLRRFARESKAAAGLDHAHIVPVYETGEDGPVPYIVSAYIPGPSLAGWLREAQRPVAPEVAARLVAALADAVQHAHERGVLHRDLKPANVLLDASGGGEPLSRPRLTDFGLARLVESAGTDETGSMACLGTPSYMAPEQAFGRSSAVGPPSDVYGLGAILYELLTGRPPFQGLTDLETMQLVTAVDPVPPRRTRRDVPPDLETVCLKCLEKEPRRRYSTAADLADDLRRVLRGEPTVARPPGPLRRLAAVARRRPRLVAVASLFVVGLVSAAATLGAVAAQLAAANTEKDELNDRLKEQMARDMARAAQRNKHRYSEQIRSAGQLLRLNHRLDAVRGLEQLIPGQGEIDEREFTWWYLHRQTSLGGRPLVGHAGDVHGVAFSKDGRFLVSGGKDGTVRVWEVATGDQVACHRGPADEVNGVAFSDDGRAVAAGSDDGTVRVWPARGGDGRVLGSVGAIVDDVLFSADGRHLAASDRNGRVHVWEVDTGRPIRTLQFDKWAVLALSRPRTASLGVIAVDGGTATLTDALTGGRVATDTVRSYVRVVAPAADGFWGAWASDTGEIEIRRPKTPRTYAPERRWLKGPTGRPESLVRSPIKNLLACGRRDSAVLLYNLNDKENNPPAVLRGHDGRVWGMAFGPDDRLLATAGGDGTVRLSDVAAETAPAPAYTAGAPVADVVFVPGTHRLVVARDGEPVRLIDPLADHTLAEWTPPAGERVNSLAVSPDGQSVIAGMTRGQYACLKLPGLQPLLAGQVCETNLVAVAATATGRAVAADSRGRLAFGPADRMPQPSIAFCDGGSNTNVAVLPRTGVVASRGEGGTVVVWDTATGRELTRLSAHAQTVEALAFSPDGTHLATGSTDKTVRVWDWRTGQLVHTMADAQGAIRGLAFSPDGRTLAIAGDDRAVRLWRTDTGLELLTLDDHPGPVRRVAFSSDGRLLVAAGRTAAGKGFVVVRDARPR
ncbi:MAG: serine/threonine-protein kinase [Gemmataceae bacterium]